MWKESDGELYIIMEFLPGEALESLWSTLPDLDKTLILEKLRGVFTRMRRLPSPGFYGSVNGGQLPHLLFHSFDNDPKISGPFQSGDSLTRGLVMKSRLNWADNKKHSYIADFFEKHFPPALDHHPSTFSHSDVQRKNIIVREITTEGSVEGKDCEVYIVDWEEAGWYPIYWEYVAAFFAFRWDDDWPSKVEEFIDAWAAEAAMMRMIYQDLWL